MMLSKAISQVLTKKNPALTIPSFSTKSEIECSRIREELANKIGVDTKHAQRHIALYVFYACEWPDYPLCTNGRWTTEAMALIGGAFSMSHRVLVCFQGIHEVHEFRIEDVPHLFQVAATGEWTMGDGFVLIDVRIEWAATVGPDRTFGFVRFDQLAVKSKRE